MTHWRERESKRVRETQRERESERDSEGERARARARLRESESESERARERERERERAHKSDESYEGSALDMDATQLAAAPTAHRLRTQCSVRREHSTSAICCSILQRVVVWCSVVQSVQCAAICCNVQPCAAVRCSVLQRAEVCCGNVLRVEKTLHHITYLLITNAQGIICEKNIKRTGNTWRGHAIRCD